MRRDYRANKNPTVVREHGVFKVCPCCRVERGRNAFVRNAKFCNDCRRDPGRRVIDPGPTRREVEAAEVAAAVARFDDFSRKVREDAGVPVGGSR